MQHISELQLSWQPLSFLHTINPPLRDIIKHQKWIIKLACCCSWISRGDNRTMCNQQEEPTEPNLKQSTLLVLIQDWLLMWTGLIFIVMVFRE